MAKSETLSETRQKFEEWVRKRYFADPEEFIALPDDFEIWQAGRLQGLEEAKLAECRCWCGRECGCPCHDGGVAIRERKQ